MGRLACRSDRRGQGLGKLPVACAVGRCLQARRQVAAYALMVDAKDEQAAAPSIATMASHEVPMRR